MEKKILPLAYHHSHFLAATLDFTFFSQWPFWGHTLFFTAGLDHIYPFWYGILIPRKITI